MKNLNIIFEAEALFISFIILIQLKWGTLGKLSQTYRKMFDVQLVVVWNLVSDMISLQFDGDPSGLGWLMVRLGNFCYALSFSVLVVTMMYFVIEYFDGLDKNIRGIWQTIIWILLGVGVFGLVLNLFTPIYYQFDIYNVYHRCALHPLSMLLPFSAACVLVGVFWRDRMTLTTTERLAFAMYFVWPLGGAVLQLAHYGISSVDFGICIATVIFLFMTKNAVYDQRTKQMRDYDQNRSYLLNSQIKSHFLFNSLSAIQGMIEEDPEEAKVAIRYLADYLRKGLDYKKREKLVSIREELEYVRNCSYMIELRMKEKIQFIYDIDESLEFDIPFLSIQPLVENAYIHGIRPKNAMGHVYVRVFREDEHHIIEVEDDGVGFDRKVPLSKRKERQQDEGAGIGLKNLRERLRIQCGGVLEIDSEPGVGTRARIIL